MGSGKTVTAATTALGADTTQAKRAAPPGAKADQAPPVRRACRGAKRSAAGMGWTADPLEGKRSAQDPQGAETSATVLNVKHEGSTGADVHVLP